LYRFLAITVLLDVKDIPQVGPLQWGRISHGLEEFCRAHHPNMLPLNTDGWLIIGTYKTERAAERDRQKFEGQFLRQYHELKIENAPDRRSMN
jgi:hypothetical protein